MPSSFTKPEIVNIGSFEFPKYGSMLQEEVEWLEAQELNAIDQAIPFLELAQKISKEQNVDEKSAIAAVNSFGSNEDLAPLLLPHISELKALKDGLLVEKQLPRRIATMFIQSRIDPSWLKSNEQNLRNALPSLNRAIPDAWQGEWTEDMTKRLPESLQKQIVSFAMAERREWVELPSETQSEDQSLGESLPPSTSGKNKVKRTGTKSSGFSSKTAS